MEMQLLGEQGILESLKSSQTAMDMAVRDAYLALTSATGWPIE